MRVEYSLPEVLQLSDRKILISRNVRFDESDFPFSQPSSSVDALDVAWNIEILDLGKVDEALPQSPVEVVDETHPTELGEAEAVDEICSAAPDPVP
ncbi:hypothetical protein O181_034469 [Austropuccinia psidii MF-1]|uniref:Uncharacterized protein n=1 Tax=Austropuccinia psidii MF-1 TaxID=1389203 RepID=A0A9Q3H9K3_9BASI|nr:hypothetical protein [Austropuccinia psidii MF-1]